MELRRIPAFGFETKGIQAKRAGRQHREEVLARGEKSSYRTDQYLDNNIGKIIGYIPILGMCAGIVHLVEAYRDVKASKKSPERKRIFKANPHRLRALIEISNLGIVLLPVDVAFWGGRKARSVALKHFGYQKAPSEVSSEKKAIQEFLDSSSSEKSYLVRRRGKVHLYKKDDMSRFALFQRKFNAGTASFSKTVKVLRENPKFYFKSSKEMEAFNQSIDLYNKKHHLRKPIVKLDPKTLAPAPVKIIKEGIIPSSPQDALNSIIAQSIHESELDVWAKVSKQCYEAVRQIRNNRIDMLCDQGGENYKIWVVNQFKWTEILKQSIRGIPLLPKNMEAILNESCPLLGPGKIAEQFMLLLVPGHIEGAPLDFMNFTRMARNVFGTFSSEHSIAKFLEKIPPVEGGYWTLISRGPVPNSQNLDEAGLKALKEQLDPDYQVISAIEMGVLLSGWKAASRKKQNWHLYSICRESIEGKPLILGASVEGSKSSLHLTTEVIPHSNPEVFISRRIT